MKKQLFILLFSCITFLGFSTGHVVNTFVINNTTCGNPNGSVRATVSGGVGPFTYSWNTSPVQNNDTAFAVLSGSYTVTVTDQNDMSTSIGVVTVTNSFNPPTILLSGQNTVCEYMTAYITTSVSGGTPAYTYSWVGPAGFTSSLQNPSIPALMGAGGTYTLVVTDANGCADTEFWTLIINPLPYIYLMPQNPTCFGACNGSINANYGGNIAGVNWSGPGNFQSTAPNPIGLCSGNYFVSVYDNFGCMNQSTIILNEPAPVTALISTNLASSCNTCDASAVATASGGSAPYVYIWNTGVTTPYITGMCPGYYNLSVQDANGCIDSAGAYLNASAIQATFSVVGDTCNQGVGSVTANITNAVGNVTYNWMPGNYNTQSISALQAGTYTLTVTDSLCSFTDLVTVPNISQVVVTASSSPTTCTTISGSVVVSANGANPPFQYSFNGSAFTTNTTFSGLQAGTYTVLAKDAIGCMNSAQTVVAYSNGEMVGFITTNSSCSNNNGTLTAYAINFSSATSYYWLPGGETTSTISNLSPGTYTCGIAGPGGCTVFGTATVLQQNTIYLGYDYDFYNCGVNSLTAAASYGQAPYTYDWQPGGLTTPTITNQNIGNYICTVTDNTGCTATGYYSIYNSYNTIISGKIYNDANSNCVYDNGDSLLPQWSVAANPASGNGGWAWAQNGTYNMYLPNVANTYSLTAYPPGGPYGNGINYYQFNCGTSSVTINASCDTVMNVNIPVTTIPAQDLTIYNYCGTARPGFYVSNSIGYSNVGTLSTSNVIVTYDLDTLLTYIGSTPPATVVSGNHLEFNLGTLTAGQSGWIYVNAIVPTIQNGGALGTLINNSAAISIVGGEQTPSDNVDACTTAITGSYDPNEKEVYAENMSPSGAIDITGRKMYYTVHFQNTGTDTAFTITVRDTISNLLDLNSLELLTASHAYTARILPDRTLELTFNNILLVDSNKNETLSHGYFNYAIHTKPGLVDGDNIANSAAIYFDFNLPIITNTVNTPVQTSVGIKETSNSLMATVFPNPLSNGDLNIKFNAALSKNVMMRIYGVGGNEVFTKQLSNNNQQSVNVAGLSAGIYFVRLSDEAGRSSDIKLVITK